MCLVSILQSRGRDWIREVVYLLSAIIYRWIGEMYLHIDLNVKLLNDNMCMHFDNLA